MKWIDVYTQWCVVLLGRLTLVALIFNSTAQSYGYLKREEHFFEISFVKCAKNNAVITYSLHYSIRVELFLGLFAGSFPEESFDLVRNFYGVKVSVFVVIFSIIIYVADG